MRKKEQSIKGYKKVSAFIDDLITTELSLEEAEDWAEDFFYEAEEEAIDLVPALLKKLKDEEQNSDVVTAVTFMLEQYGDEIVIDPIVELFKNPEISDTTRSALLGVLDYYGVDIQDPNLMSYFRDIKGLGQTALEGVLQLLEQEEMLETVLQEISGFPTEVRLRMIHELGKSRDERAIPLLGAFAEHPDKELAEAAILQLGSIRSGQSIEILENLITHQEESRELIERSLRKLQFAGVTKEATPTEDLPIYRCLLSWIDGRGSQIMLIARQKDARQVMVSNLMLNEKVGIKDCSGTSNLSLKGFDKMARQLKKQVGGMEVEYSYCVQLVQNALWTALKNKAAISPLFPLYRKIFRNDPLTPQSYLVDLAPYGLEEVQQHLEELLNRSDELISEPPFSEWWLDIPTSYDFVQKKKRALKRERRDPQIIREFFAQVMEPERESLVRRLELTVDFLGKKNLKTQREQIQKALAVWVALKEQRRPPENIPFTRELAIITLENVFRNVQMGFTEPESEILEY